ncbi:hypothetical protein FYA67_07380 [Bordetella holmesii]|nr:hypothetical protein FYB59_07375 [Bordetella holmesii]QGB14723.1 hypothetical protein FYB57_07375 [Bordetella holmesii]QGB63966.1 hypothetical protein FYB43_07375 [Bordetella holmesii]QGC42515.1 hypothetical protein FYB19_07385 [Bordetella holmesii]QGC62424.1 hypothetical protein FYB13_07385 [Bordetella holmesii]
MHRPYAQAHGAGAAYQPETRGNTLGRADSTSCEDSIGCMHGSSEPDLRNWKSPTPQFTQGARPDEHP